MDEICSAILNKLCDVGEVGNYIILEEDELFEVFPKNAEKNRAVLEGALSKLQSDGFIELRYSRGNLFCLAPLKKYETPLPITNIKVDSTTKKGGVVYLIYSLLCSFFGALAGGIIAGLF